MTTSITTSILCDSPGCGAVFLGTVGCKAGGDSSKAMAREGGWACLHRTDGYIDYCPEHRPARSGRGPHPHPLEAAVREHTAQGMTIRASAELLGVGSGVVSGLRQRLGLHSGRPRGSWKKRVDRLG